MIHESQIALIRRHLDEHVHLLLHRDRFRRLHPAPHYLVLDFEQHLRCAGVHIFHHSVFVAVRHLPQIQRVVQENAQHREDQLLVLANQVHAELHLLAQQAIHALHSQAIHKLTRQSEWNRLRNAQQSSLLEQNPKVDMNELSRLLVNHNIPQMAISQPHDIPDNAVDAEGRDEVQNVVIPQLRMHESLQKEVVEHRSELLCDGLVKFQALLLVVLPDLLEFLQNCTVLDLSRMIAMVRRSLLCALPIHELTRKRADKSSTR